VGRELGPGLLINFNGPELNDGIKRFVPWPFVLFVSFVVKRISECGQRHAGGRPDLAPLMPGVRECDPSEASPGPGVRVSGRLSRSRARANHNAPDT